MNKLEISDDSRLDAIEAALWYESQRYGLGIDFEMCLEAGLNRVLRNPLHYEVKYENVRVCFIDRFPFGIHFILEDTIIRVFGIFHTHRNPTDWLERLE
jgi:toxin ParE1/3/4